MAVIGEIVEDLCSAVELAGPYNDITTRSYVGRDSETAVKRVSDMQKYNADYVSIRDANNDFGPDPALTSPEPRFRVISGVAATLKSDMQTHRLLTKRCSEAVCNPSFNPPAKQ